MRKIYLNNAISIINNINWNMVGTNGSNEDGDLAYEFLRRLAQFFKQESIEPIRPGVANIANLLGDTSERILISEYCCTEASVFLDKYGNTGNVVRFYLQLAKYADKNSYAAKYLRVYEPMIKILERGGMFVLRYASLEVEKAGRFPLSEWYEWFVVKEPIDISKLN